MFVAFLVVGWLAAGRVREGTAKDLLTAGRALPVWLAVLTTTATWVDGGYLLGTVEFTRSRLAAGWQGGICFGLSLMLGGLLFAVPLRKREYTTLVDPFESRFGAGWAAVLMLPAISGEIFWSGELLVAMASTLGVIIDIDPTTAVLASVAVVTAYTLVGGMWSVAYTDAFQLALVPIGMIAAMPFALAAVGGAQACFDGYVAQQGSLARLFPPVTADGNWPFATIVGWWETSIVLVLGGIPWNCYFQRVLSCNSAVEARRHSVLAGGLTMLLTLPPLVLGMATLVYTGWSAAQQEQLREMPALALPMLLRTMVPPAIAMLGMAAIIGAVTSSLSSSILSAGSMFSWNVYRRLIAPGVTVGRLRQIVRLSIFAVAALATWLALKVQSVAELWFFTADLVFVLLFPQLVAAVFDRRANRYGSIAAFATSLSIRLSGGISILGVGAAVDFPQLWASLAGGDPALWYDPAGNSCFPVRLLAGGVGMVLLPVVSRLTARWDPRKELDRVDD
jgi:high affinity choline transporter 7